MRFSRIFLSLIGLAVLASAPLALGQDAPQAITTLKTKDNLSADETQQLTAWVDETIVAIGGNDGIAAAQSLRALTALDSGGKPGFREALATAIFAGVRSGLPKANVEGAARLARAAAITDRAEAATVLVAALADERAAVRAAAAFGLKKLQPRLAQAGGQFITTTLDALVNAAKAENSRGALVAEYEALNFPANSPAAADAVKAMVRVLEGRWSVDATDKVAAEGGDLVALRALAPRAKSLDAGVQRQLAIVAARIARLNVLNYTTDRATGEQAMMKVKDNDSPEVVARRNAAEQTIIECEGILAALAGPAPANTLVQAMQALNATDMKVAWGTWTEQLRTKFNINVALPGG
ncbi:MAG: hypothetical protein SF069_19040 [Phycisphaerae bacterium]|nr:hypothetical protein [Phycisphaerae bacterium]